MRLLVLALLALSLTACGPRWDLRSEADGWTTYRRGKSTRHTKLGGGIVSRSVSYSEQGNAWLISPGVVAIRSGRPIKPDEPVWVFQRGHWVWCTLKGHRKGWQLVGDPRLSLEMPPMSGPKRRAF